MILNAYWEPLEFELPQISDRWNAWQRLIDTQLDAPEDILDWELSPEIHNGIYNVGSRSVVVLFARSALS